MTPSPSAAAPAPLTRTAWLICIIASIGFAFDIYELLMLPLIIKPAIASLSAPLVEQLVAGGMDRAKAAAMWSPGGEAYVQWARTLFFVPAIAGGIFGLLGGYLTDLLGRRRQQYEEPNQAEQLVCHQHQNLMLQLQLLGPFHRVQSTGHYYLY